MFFTKISHLIVYILYIRYWYSNIYADLQCLIPYLYNFSLSLSVSDALNHLEIQYFTFN